MVLWLKQRWGVIVIIVSLLLFTWPYYAFNAADRGSIRNGDIDSQYYSLARWMSVTVSQGTLPLWNPSTFGGSPFIAEPQAEALYPPRWGTLALGYLVSGNGTLPFAVFELEIFAHLLMAGLLTYCFLRRLHLSVPAAVLGGVAWMYSGFMTGYPLEQVSILEATIWFPGILWAIEGGVQGNRRGFWWASLFLALSFLAGSPQITLYGGYAALAYFAYRAHGEGLAWRRAVALGVGWGCLTLLMVVAQAIPTLELMRQSARASATYEFVGNGLGFGDLVELVLPHATTIHASLYVGIAPLVLAGAMLALKPLVAVRRYATVPFWGAMALVALLLSFGAGSALFGWLYQFVPGIGLFRSQERSVFLWALAVAVLAAMALDYMLRPPLTEKPIEGLTGSTQKLVAVLFPLGWLATFYTYIQDHPTFPAVAFLALLLTILFFLLKSYTPHRAWYLALLGLIVIDLFTINGRTAWSNDLPTDHEEVPGLLEALPPGQSPVLDIYGEVNPNAGALANVPTISGASQLRLARYDTWRSTLPSAVWWRGWGVTHIATPDEGLDISSTVINQSTIHDVPYYLHQITTPAARATLHYAVERIEAEASILQFLTDHQEADRPIVVEAPVTVEPGTGQILTQSITVNQWTLTAETSTPALLRLALPYYPGWQATIDGQSVPLYRVDGLWTGVSLPGGTHQVELTFMPILWGGALLVSVVGWGIWIGGILFWSKRG